MAWFARRTAWLVVPSLTLLVACGDASEAEIGPDGGELRIDHLTVVIPPGAMGTTRKLKISPSEANLSRSSFQQVGDAYLLEPTDLRLKIPATATFTKLKDVSQPAVLHQFGDAGKIHSYTPPEGEDAVAYIGAFGTIAAAKAGEPSATIDMPTLLATPYDAGPSAPIVDTLAMKVTPNGINLVDVVLTAYDMNGENNRDLNGGAFCAFKIQNVQGASIATGCTTGSTTVTLGLTSSSVDFEAIPFLLGKVDSPVVIHVEVGSQELVNTLGYLSFGTSACFYETCSGRGTCVESGGQAACMCDPGYAPSAPEDGLGCECVPQCDGRMCGGDSCGGSCGSCGDGFQCNDEAGACEPVMQDTTSTTGPDPTTSSTGPDPTTSTTSTTTTTTSTTDPTTGTTDMGTTDPTTGTTGTTGP
ncbi:MAG: calcium-binding EGF-like domain-containing protein [Nannocystaceae bacterium]